MNAKRFRATCLALLALVPAFTLIGATPVSVACGGWSSMFDPECKEHCSATGYSGSCVYCDDPGQDDDCTKCYWSDQVHCVTGGGCSYDCDTGCDPSQSSEAYSCECQPVENGPSGSDECVLNQNCNDANQDGACDTHPCEGVNNASPGDYCSAQPCTSKCGDFCLGSKCFDDNVGTSDMENEFESPLYADARHATEAARALAMMPLGVLP